MTNSPNKLADELEALRQRLSDPKPTPVPEQDSRVGEAMAGIQDDKNYREWRERVAIANRELVDRLPEIITSLRPTPAPDVVEAVPDTDLVCTTCRWRGGHSPDCPRKDEPWPTFVAASQPATDVAALVEAAKALQADLIERGEWDKDGAGKVVCAGNGVWIRFCAALRNLGGQ